MAAHGVGAGVRPERLGLLCRSIGYSPGEAGTWDTLGVVWQRLGDHAVLLHLGDSYALTGDAVGARAAWEESVMILEVLHHPSTGEVRARLGSLTLRFVVSVPSGQSAA